MDARGKAEAAAAAAAKRRKTERVARDFGRSKSGSLVDLDALASTETMGFPRALAAEAIHATEKNTQAALEALAFDRETLEGAAAAKAASRGERRASLKRRRSLRERRRRRRGRRRRERR